MNRNYEMKKIYDNALKTMNILEKKVNRIFRFLHHSENGAKDLARLQNRINAMRDTLRYGRMKLIESIRVVDDTKIPQLKELSYDRDPDVRGETAVVLSRYRGEHPERPMAILRNMLFKKSGALKETDSETRDDIYESLAKIAKRYKEHSDVVHKAIASLENAVRKEKEPNRRIDILVYGSSIGLEFAHVILDSFGDDNELVREAAEHLWKGIEKRMKQEVSRQQKENPRR